MADKATPTATAPVAAPAAPPATWFIDANTLTCVDQQETNATHGDEVYVASLKFRTKPGVAGTTSVTFTGGLVDIDDVNTGEAHTIPNAMGRVPFANVTRLGLADIGAGQVPEVIGTATVAVESDLTADKAVDKFFTKAATEVEPILAAASEQISFADILVDDDALPAVLDQLISDVTAALEPGFFQKVGRFFSSFGDPDDPIDHKLNLFLAVDDTLRVAVDAAVANALDPADGVGGAVATRTYTQRFSGRGAIYDISFTLST
jgi:hypothetical protein